MTIAPPSLGPVLRVLKVQVTGPPPMAGSGVPVLVKPRSAPAITVVVAFWLLLAGLASLSADSSAVALITDGPATVARQVSTMLRTSAPNGPRLPKSHCTVVALTGAQFCNAGEADTNAALAGTVKVSRVLVDASTALLSTRIV